MARRTPPRRSKPRDAGRRGKKKISALVIGKVDYVDYKDAELLRKFVSERSKLKARRVTGNSEQQQREVARAVKNAREMADERLIRHYNQHTHQVEETRDWLPNGSLTVGVTAGASCPNNLIEDVIRRLLELRGTSAEEVLTSP